MESRNFSDWTFSIGGAALVWRLDTNPVSLVLSEKTGSLPIARFTYSVYGTNATDGADVGELAIYRHGLTMDIKGVEKVMASLMIPLTNFKNLGTNFRNVD